MIMWTQLEVKHLNNLENSFNEPYMDFNSF